MAAKVNFYKSKIQLQIKGATEETIKNIAHRIEERAKINVVDNDQIDTGAMLNGIYVVTRHSSGYGQAKAKADSANPDAQMAGPINLGSADAAVVAGMEYSIYQEMQQSFLYKAAEQTGPEVGGLIKKL